LHDPRDAGPHAPLLERGAGRYVVLDFDDRHAPADGDEGTRGLEFLLDLENATVLRVATRWCSTMTG